MRTVLLIATDTIRSLLHERVISGLMLLTVLLTVAFSIIMTQMQDLAEGASELSTQREELRRSDEMQESMQMQFTFSRLVLGVFYWFVSLSGTVVAAFVFATAASGDIRRGTIFIVLSKPVSRTQFLLGKYSGALAVIVGYSALTGIAVLAFTYVNGLDVSSAARIAPMVTLCHGLMVGSLALLLSLFMHPLLAAILAYFANAGYFSPPNPLYFILPSYDQYNVFQLLSTERVLSAGDLLTLTLYALDVAAILLLLALWRFRTRQLI